METNPAKFFIWKQENFPKCRTKKCGSNTWSQKPEPRKHEAKRGEKESDERGSPLLGLGRKTEGIHSREVQLYCCTQE